MTVVEQEARVCSCHYEPMEQNGNGFRCKVKQKEARRRWAADRHQARMAEAAAEAGMTVEEYKKHQKSKAAKAAAVTRYAGKIPTARLLPAIEIYERETEQRFREYDDSLDRRIFRMKEEKEEVTFAAAERLLIDIGLDHWWHTHLADLYELAV